MPNVSLKINKEEYIESIPKQGKKIQAFLNKERKYSKADS
jgi:hypothetical protein